MPTFYKCIGRLGKRAILEVLLLKHGDGYEIDTTLSFGIGPNQGLSFSLLCPGLLVEISVFPLNSKTAKMLLGYE